MMRKNTLDSAKEVLKLEIEAMIQAQSRLGEGFEQAIDLILTSHGRLVVCGMGKSGLVGKKISATLSSTGTPSFFLHPAEALHGDLGMVTEQDVVLLLSNSGETEEIVRLIPFVRRIGARIIAMVGNPDSTLGKNSDTIINTGVEREACPLNLAPMSSTTVTIALGDALAGALIVARSFKEKDFARFHPSGSLGRKFLVVKDLMHAEDEIPFVSPETFLQQAILDMSKKGFGALIVSDSTKKLFGVFTDGDLRRFFETADNLNVKIAQVMTKNPTTVSSKTLAMAALKIMEDKAITSLPVVDNDIVVGFLHLHDILKARLV
jgi:arabinose-5-phosphate isomerase